MENLQVISLLDASLGVALKQFSYADIVLLSSDIVRPSSPTCLNFDFPGTDDLLFDSHVMGQFSPYFSRIDSSQQVNLNGHENHEDPDCHLKLLLEDLRTICQTSSAEVRVKESNEGKAILILVNVLHRKDLMKFVSQANPKYIFCFFECVADWSVWLNDPCLVELKHLFSSLGVKFRAFQSSSVASDVRALISTRILGCVGSTLIVGDSGDSNNDQFKNLSVDFVKALRPSTGGPCVDELYMLSHTQSNLKYENLNFLRGAGSSMSQSFLIVGSGPSLDGSIQTIKKLQKSNLIVCAGSSAGTLLRHGIQPDFHVHVERGGDGSTADVYQELLLKHNHTDFGQTIGVFPTSIEPGLVQLYHAYLFYARPGQSPVDAWPALKSCTLQFEGTECLSTAFAFTLSLSPSRVLMFGCDLGSVSSTSNRSAWSVGNSDRNFDLTFPGNLSARVHTNRAMLLQASYMEACAYDSHALPEILNFSDGIKLPFSIPANIETIDVSSAHPCLRADLLQQVSSVIDNSTDLLFCDSFGKKVSLSSMQWFSDWQQLASQAPSISSSMTRLEASRLLSLPNSPELMLVYKVFRGSLRDAFWLVSVATEKYCTELNPKLKCWNAFSCFDESLRIEFDHLVWRLAYDVELGSKYTD